MLATALGAALAQDARCLALARLRLPRVSIEQAETIFGPVNGAPQVVAAVPVCRIRGVARPAPGSQVGFDLWLPRDRWNGRYYQLGNGGFAGNIHLPSLAAEAARGNAAAATDTGHKGSGFEAAWAHGNPAAIADYGYRSIKATADVAALLIRAYYGRAAQWRYYAGCSNGGRQALMAAARYPQDWDGILAGAPAARWTSQLATFASLQAVLRASPARWLDRAQLALIQQRALASCPRGAVAGTIALNPPACDFRPRDLSCATAQGGACLTEDQMISLRAIMAAGYQPTSAAYPDGWATWILNPDPTQPSQLTFAREASRHLFTAAAPADGARLYGATQERLHAALDVDPAALVAFGRRGGRIVSYFGWADPLLSPRDGLDFYREVARRAGGAATFYRQFMVPGMGHCQGGVGATAFGQSLPARAMGDDAAHDIRAALEQWVEQGRPPQIVIASDPQTGSTRTLLPAR